MPIHPPPYTPTAPNQPIHTIETQQADTTATTLVTNTHKYTLPPDWWTITCAHASKYDLEFCYYYSKTDEEGAILCLEGHRDAATIPFHQCYWLAIEYFLTKVAKHPIPPNIITTTQQETIYWTTRWRNWNLAITQGPWDLV